MDREAYQLKRSVSPGHLTAIILQLLGATAILLNNIDQGFPYLAHANEGQLYTMSQRILTIGRRTTRADYSPGFVFVLVAQGKLLEIITPGAVPPYVNFLFGRVTSAFLGIAALSTLYAICRRFKSPLAGLLAASFLAVFRAFVVQSHTIMADIPATFWGVLALWFSLIALDRGDKWLILSLLTGLAAFITKFNTLPAVGLPLLTAIIKYWNQPRRLFMIGGLVLVGIVVGLGLIHLQFDLTNSLVSHRRTANIFEKRNLLQLVGAPENWDTIWKTVGIWTFLVILVGIPAGLTINRAWNFVTVQMLAVVACFAVAFFLILSLFNPTDIRDFLLLVASAAILWGLSLAWLPPRRYQLLALIPAIGMLLPQGQASWQRTVEMGLPHTTTLASDWFVAEVPQGARILTEFSSLYFSNYNGYVGPSVYNDRIVESLLDFDLADLQQRGVEYVVANSWATKTGYFNSPDHPTWIDDLEILEDIPNVERRGPRYLILKVPPIQESPRYLWVGDLVEVGGNYVHPFSFRGYDLPRTELRPGFVLEFTLYWMSVWPTGTDYVVKTRLLDATTGEIAAEQETTPDSGSQLTSAWEGSMQFIPDRHLMALPADLPAGTYQLEASLVNPDTGESLPVSNLEGENVGETISLGEITITQ